MKADDKAQLDAAMAKVKDWCRDDLIVECLSLYDRIDRMNETIRLTSLELGEVRRAAEVEPLAGGLQNEEESLAPITERSNWKDVTPDDATAAELHLVHMISGPKPQWMTDENWRTNMRSIAKDIRAHVARVNVIQEAPQLASDQELERVEKAVERLQNEVAIHRSLEADGGTAYQLADDIEIVLSALKQVQPKQKIL